MNDLTRNSYQRNFPQDIAQVIVDEKNPSILYAKLANGATVVLHTKYREAQESTSFNPLAFFSRKKKKDVHTCKIFRTIPSSFQDLNAFIDGTVAVTKNYLITAEKDQFMVNMLFLICMHLLFFYNITGRHH